MEPSGKRKRADETEAEGRRPAEPDGEKTVTDDEVEEFFAILRRMHVAAKYFKRSDGDPAAAKRWMPAFEVEDFAEVDGDKVAEEKEEAVAEEEDNSGLDLNCVPPTCLEDDVVL